MNTDVNETLQKITKGAGIILIGTIISMVFLFLSRVIIARSYTTSEYGVFNLALTILDITLIFATLGFQNSLPREISYYKKTDPLKVDKIIFSAIIITTCISLILTIILILCSHEISRLFKDENLNYSLKIVALAVPFSALIIVTTSISRGFGRVREQVYFQAILNQTLFFVLVEIIVFLKLSFIYVLFSYLIAQVLTFFALITDIYRIKLFKFKYSFDFKLGKELICFSIPLMFTGILGYTMMWIDNLMLGYYKSSRIVGLYNSAAPIAKLLPIFLNCSGLIYPSLVTIFYTQGKLKEMGKVYQILTKWIFLATFPIFIIVFLFPEVVISFFFGYNYISSALALKILALGFMFHIAMGLNGISLVVIKDSNFIMYSTLISAVLNVILNILLIPSYGIKGASIATAVSYFIMNILNSLRLYQKTGIHPFSRSYIRILAISIILLGIIEISGLKVLDIWHTFLILVIFLVIYLSLLLISKSIDEEDIKFLLAIEKKLKLNLTLILKILRKFI